MAAGANFASVNPRCSGARTPGSADSNLGTPVNTTTVATGGASGSKVERIRLTPVASLSGTGFVNLFRYDGSQYHFLEGFYFNSLTVSASVEPAPVSPPTPGSIWVGGIIDKPYDDLYLPNGWTLRCTCTTAALQANVDVMAELGDF